MSDNWDGRYLTEPEIISIGKNLLIKSFRQIEETDGKLEYKG